MAEVTHRPVTLTAGLAFVAGYVDAVGFIALFGLFTAHVTGNFILIGAALTGSGTGLAGKLLALPVFVLAVALTRIVVLANEKDNVLRNLLLYQAALLSAFMMLGVIAAPITDPDAPLAITAGLFGVLAMGVQNAAGRLILTDAAPTTIMTGNTTQIVIDLVDRSRADVEGRAAANLRLRKMLPAVLAFATGAVSAASAFVYLSFWCLAAPITLIILIAACSLVRKT